MADYTNITESATDPDAPVTAGLVKALRDNPIAIAEGAVGAPRMTRTSLLAPVAGAGGTIARMLPVTGTINATVRSEVLRCLRGGTIRINVGFANGTGTGTNSTVIYRHGAAKTAVAQNTTLGASGTLTADISVSVGDMIYVEVTSGASTNGTMTSFTMESSNDGGMFA